MAPGVARTDLVGSSVWSRCLIALGMMLMMLMMLLVPCARASNEGGRPEASGQALSPSLTPTGRPNITEHEELTSVSETLPQALVHSLPFPPGNSDNSTNQKSPGEPLLIVPVQPSSPAHSVWSTVSGISAFQKL